MKKRLKKLYIYFFHSSTIFKQFILFTLLVSLIPIIFISMLLLQRINNMVTQEIVNSHKQLILQYMSNVNDKLYQFKESINQISNNTIILNTLMDSSNAESPYTKGNDVSTEVTKSLRLESHKELKSCVIYSYIFENKIYGIRVTMAEQAENESWYEEFKSRADSEELYKRTDKQNKVFSLMKNIVYIDLKNFRKRNIGVIKLDIDIKQLFSPAMVQNKYYDIIVSDSDNQIIYSSNAEYNAIFPDLPLKELSTDKVYYYNDTMINGEILADTSFQILFLFDNSQLALSRAEMQKAVLPVIFLVILIIIIMAYAFTRGFTSRVERLIHKIKVAETGDLTISGEIEGNDEIATLDKQFNHMLIKLDKLIQRNYIQQLEKKETEFRNLQLQINPHFLYNTLETISSIAAVRQVFSICELCEKLGEIFRYSLGKNQGEYVMVAQELKHTQNYVYIQKIRYGNKFEVFYNIEPEAEKLLLLRFILQPIVENAIVHGLSRITGSGTLEIGISTEAGRLVIKIEDDGIGMMPDKVDALSSYINSETAGTESNRQSIGIRNVNQRIKLACGKEYGIRIESESGRGSCFTIYLPLLYSGGNVI